LESSFSSLPVGDDDAVSLLSISTSPLVERLESGVKREGDERKKERTSLSKLAISLSSPSVSLSHSLYSSSLPNLTLSSSPPTSYLLFDGKNTLSGQSVE